MCASGALQVFKTAFLCMGQSSLHSPVQLWVLAIIFADFNEAAEGWKLQNHDSIGLPRSHALHRYGVHMFQNFSTDSVKLLGFEQALLISAC